MKSLLLQQSWKAIFIKNWKLNENKNFIQLKWKMPHIEVIYLQVEFNMQMFDGSNFLIYQFYDLLGKASVIKEKLLYFFFVD